jgi:hypothetical protein
MDHELPIEMRDGAGHGLADIGADDPQLGSSLHPADSGLHAWLFLFSCVMLEALCWGFPSIFGVFQSYYSTHEPFAGSDNIAVIGTCALGIMYLELPFIFSILKAWPNLRRWSTVTGLLAMCLSLALGSFAKSVSQLIATQGVLYALGGGFAWTPLLFYIEEWFVRRLSFAYGVMMVSLISHISCHSLSMIMQKS